MLCKLYWVQIKTACKRFGFWLYDVTHFYSRLSFLLTETLLFSKSFWFSPFERSSQAQKLLPNKEYTYGETPLKTIEKIACVCRLQPSDYVLDLGAGRGRLLFWLEAFVGCRCAGIESIASIVKLGQAVAKKRNIEKVELFVGDFKSQDFSPYTVLYLYGICLKEESMEALENKMKQCKPGTKIITVSAPLSDPSFVVMNVFPGEFDWGTTSIYLHVRQ